ncbi:MAG: hypothetical protein JST92_09865 [Deltaproteobacteria bacterium]|nr:hypothetical protein [Deltaproteobacteria bacterium]
MINGPGPGSNGGAIPFAVVVGGGGGIDQGPGSGGLANYVATFTPGTTPIGGLSFMVDHTWQANPPRWTTDSAGNPILNCDTQRRRSTDNGVNGVNAIDGTDAIVLGGTNLQVDGFFHTERMWASTCQLTNLILTEWYRKIAGTPSCLDMTSTACDWMPQDFVDRFVTRNMSYASAAKEIEYSYCKRWTNAGSWDDTLTAKQPQLSCPGVFPKGSTQLIYGVPQSKRNSLASIRQYLDTRRNGFECLMKSVPVALPEVFGKVKKDSNHLGNGEFGGGYDYDLEWHATVKRDQHAGANKDKICTMGGSMQAGFNAFATLFSDNISILDANVHVRSNENFDGKGEGWANLVVASFTVFDQGDEQHPISIAGNAVNLDKLNNDKIQFVEAPFQVGWVTVTIKAGIFFDYGATLTIGADVPSGKCDVSQGLDAWGAHAKFEPQADLGVWVSADATIGGAFGVGLEVDLILLGLGLPLTADVVLGVDPNTQQPAISFDAELDFTLTTLKGELDFYIIAFFIKVASFKIVGWDGFVQKFPIFRTHAESGPGNAVYIPLAPLTKDAIHPPGTHDASEDI